MQTPNLINPWTNESQAVREVTSDEEVETLQEALRAKPVSSCIIRLPKQQPGRLFVVGYGMDREHPTSFSAGPMSAQGNASPPHVFMLTLMQALFMAVRFTAPTEEDLPE